MFLPVLPLLKSHTLSNEPVNAKEDMMRAKTTLGMVVIGAAVLFAACQPAEEAVTTEEPLKVEPAKPAQTKATVKPAAVKATTSKAASGDAVLAMAPGAQRPAAAKESEEIVTTMSGCLERDGDAFQLTDTSGDHAPKARSWKSGFVKKGSASVDVLDGANRLNLASHVGHRISVSGTLAGREMRARSMRATTESCD